MKKFQIKIEDFVCKNCGTGVKGDGYTNHCPKCLWSRYVDVNPGDREEKRGGTMKPTGIFLESAENTIVHICVKCGFERSNKVRTADDFNAVIKASARFYE